MKEGDFLIALVVSQLKEERLNREVIAEIEKGDISKLYRLSCIHSVTNLVHDALIDNGVNFSKEVLSKFKNEKLKLNLKSQRLEYASLEIFKALEDAKIYFLPLKGSVTKKYYPKENMRFSSDVDILIKKEDEKRVQKILTEQCDLKFYKSYQDEKTYITTDGEFLETHIDIVDGEKAYAKIFDNILEKCSSAENGSCRLVMPNEYVATYNVAHLAKHFRQGGCGLRPIMDAFIIKEKMLYDNGRVEGLLEKIGLKKFYQGVMALVNCFFNGGEYSNDLLIMKEYILNGGNYGSLGNKVLLDSVAKNKGVSFFRKAFPNVSYLKGSYKILEKSFLFYPFCLIHRWCSLLFGKRKILAKKMTAEKGQVTEERKQEILSMQDYLGIK